MIEIINPIKIKLTPVIAKGASLGSVPSEAQAA
jgi:hypothetical protein